MTRRDELLALAERVEAATHNDKSLFEDVWEALCRSSVDFRRYACTTTDGNGWTVTGRFMRFLDVGAFFDAAMSLVPEGCTWSAGDWSAIDEGASATCWPPEHCRLPDFNGISRGATPELALTAAALRALAEIEQ
jgi:hypothetical protein